jgi:hypothetical protein
MAAWLALFTFAVCYFRSFIFPHVPLLPGGDGIGFFVAGSRIVVGQLPYRDFFEIVPVGTDLTYAVLIKWFGFYTWVPGLVMDCLAAAIVIFMTLIAARLMQGFAIVLPGLLLAGFVLLGSLDATHHWFSTLAAMAGLLVLLDGITFPRIAVTGALCGLAACFTQTVGATVLASFLAYLIWKMRRDAAPVRERWRKCLLLAGVAAIVFAAVNGYFIWAAGLRQWLFCIIVYPLRYFTVPAINNWRVVQYDFRWHPRLGRWVSYPFLYATVPLVYFVFSLVLYRRRGKDRNESWGQLLLVALTGFAMFLAIAPSPSLLRLASVSPPAMILLVWLLNQPGKTATRLRTTVAVAAVAVALAVPVHYQTRWRAYLDLPAGRTAFSDPVQWEEYRWVLGHTHAGQYFFGLPPLYLPFHFLNPAAVEGLDSSDYTRPEQVLAALQALEKHPVPLMILRVANKDDLYRSTGSPSDHLDPFRDYLRQHYRLTTMFPNNCQVWERIDGRRPSRDYTDRR